MNNQQKFQALLNSNEPRNVQIALEMAKGSGELSMQLKQTITDLIQVLVDHNSYKKESTDQSSVVDLEDFTAQLRTYFSTIFGKDFVEKRFELPKDFETYLKLGTSFYQPTWRAVYHSGAILSSTLDPHYSWAIDDLSARVASQQLLEQDTIWLYIGYWSDKHDYFVCCDKTHSYFGRVFDCYDTDPYGYDYACYCFSFIHFLKALGPEDDLWQY